MPAVLDRPVVDNIIDTVKDEQPIWILFVHETATQAALDIGAILLKIMPELNREKISAIVVNLRNKHIGIVYKGDKPMVERYAERLKRNDLSVTMERE